EVTLPTRTPINVRLTLRKGRVTIAPNRLADINSTTVLHDDTDPRGPTVVRVGTLSFQIIKRADTKGDRFGVRIKDSESKARKNFRGLDYFPFDPEYRVEARFEPNQPPKHIPIINVLGMTSDEVSP